MPIIQLNLFHVDPKLNVWYQSVGLKTVLVSSLCLQGSWNASWWHDCVGDHKSSTARHSYASPFPGCEKLSPSALLFLPHKNYQGSLNPKELSRGVFKGRWKKGKLCLTGLIRPQLGVTQPHILGSGVTPKQATGPYKAPWVTLCKLIICNLRAH